MPVVPSCGALCALPIQSQPGLFEEAMLWLVQWGPLLAAVPLAVVTLGLVAAAITLREGADIGDL